PRVFLAPEVLAASSREEALSQLGNLRDLQRSVVVDNGKIARQDPNPSQQAGSLRDFRLSPNEVSVSYIANMPGVLTLADSFSEGWHAEVNGLQTPVLRVDGAFRGVEITTPGEVTVHFWYRPPRWHLSLALCGLGLIILLVSSVNAVRRHFG